MSIGTVYLLTREQYTFESIVSAYEQQAALSGDTI